MGTLLLGALLAIAAMAWVLYPLFAGSVAPRESPPAKAEPRPDADTDAGRSDAHSAEDAAEALIRAYRQRPPECPACGPRPEPDAIFCSTCGRKLLAGTSRGRSAGSNPA